MNYVIALRNYSVNKPHRCVTTTNNTVVRGMHATDALLIHRTRISGVPYIVRNFAYFFCDDVCACAGGSVRKLYPCSNVPQHRGL
jgi:hypothetical protein